MKRIISILLTILLPLIVSGQTSNSGSVKGNVLDAGANVPFENVTVALYSFPDSAITKGVATDQEGNFLIENIPLGDWLISTTFVGYKGKSFRFSLTDENSDIELGEIVLSESAGDLGNVDVIAVRPQIIYRDNKKILKVREFQDAGASTLSEVLENAPSITLDADGNVLLRGSGNYTLLIDGKPVPGVGVSMLRQIPPEMVEDIEIMTNPSAKYDPDGVSGIINLILKKQTQAGVNGQLTLMAGLNDKYNGDLQVNYRKNRVNMFAGVTGTSYSTEIKGDIYRETGDVSTESEILNQMNQQTKVNTVVGNLGFDLTLNDYNSITISGRFGPQNVSAKLKNNITRVLSDPGLTGNYIFSNNLGVKGTFYIPSITWDHKFKKEGHKLQINTFVGGFQGDLTQEMIEEEADANWYPTGIVSDGKQLVNDMSINDFRAKADYENVFEGKGRLQAGYQARILDEENYFTMGVWEPLLGRYNEDPTADNDFRLNRVIHSLYFTWGGDLGKFNYQLGLRGEHTDRLVEQRITGESYDYDKVDFFPSVNISRRFKDAMQLQLSYSRRINRPGRFNLNPFPQYADNQLTVIGNPHLKPEFVDSYELSFQNQVKLGFFSVEAYYRKVNDLITNILKAGTEGMMSQVFTNANSSHSAGTELMFNLQPSQWMRLVISGNLYYYLLDDETIYQGNDNESFVWTSNATAVFLPTKTTRFTLQGVYNGPTISLQGSTKATYMINVGLRQELFKRKASLALSVRDLFSTFKIDNELQGENFTSVISLKPESRVMTLTFTYNINNYSRRSVDDDMELNFIR